MMKTYGQTLGLAALLVAVTFGTGCRDEPAENASQTRFDDSSTDLDAGDVQEALEALLARLEDTQAALDDAEAELASVTNALNVLDNRVTVDESRVGNTTDGMWCRGAGNSVECDQAEPVLFESDPTVGTLQNGRWCTTNGTTVNCTSTPALSNQACAYGGLRGINANGTVACQNRVGFLARRATGFNPTDGVITIIPFDDEVYDYGNNFNASTGIFTAPVDGWYAFSAGIMVQGVSVGDLYYAHLRVGSYNHGAPGGYATSTNWNADTLSAMVYMTAGQTAYLYAYINSTSGNGYFYGNSAGNYMWTYLQGGLIE